MVDHIAFIMDGNRRFSKRLMKEPWKGHEWGAKKFHDVLDWCYEAGVREVTVYAFSMQNFNRSRNEYEYLMRLFEKELIHMSENYSDLQEKGMQIRFIGRTHLLSQSLQECMRDVEELTKDHKTRRVNICIAYGGKEEVEDAVKIISRQIASKEIMPEDVDIGLISSYMGVESEPDIIIRTGGDHRTSNFLIWQSSYSEWFFLDTLWPELTREEVLRCVKEFEQRERRFGK